MKDKKEKIKKVYRFVGCNHCHRTNGITLIKATDSYYCKECFDYLIEKGKIKRG